MCLGVDMKKIIEKHYIDNHSRMVKLLSNRAGTMQNAEDVVQDAFEKALRYSNSFDPKLQEFGAWFNTILNNALRTHKAVEKRLGMSVEYNEDLDEPVPMMEWQEGIVNVIKREIERKPMPVKQALYLYFFKGYKPREIAVVVDMTNGYIRTTVKEFKIEMREKHGGIML